MNRKNKIKKILIVVEDIEKVLSRVIGT